jgi:hypothetical protein
MLQLDGSQTDWVPLNFSGDWPQNLLRIARGQRCLNFDLGTISFGKPDLTAVLIELNRIRAVASAGFRFRCDLLGRLQPDQGALLKRAGVVDVLLINENSCAPDGRRSASGLSHVVQDLRFLCEHAIKVTWRLPAFKERMTEPSMVKLLSHLPPPIFDGESSFASRWADANRLGTFTYSRGPGFVKILDRRFKSSNWRFTTLRGFSADLFMILRCVFHISDLEKHFPDVSYYHLNDLVDTLAEAGIVLKEDDSVQVLPVRRSAAEHWASSYY